MIEKEALHSFLSFFLFLHYTHFCSNYAHVLRHSSPFVQEYTPSLMLVAIYLPQFGMNIQNIVCNFLLCNVDKLLLIIIFYCVM